MTDDLGRGAPRADTAATAGTVVAVGVHAIDITVAVIVQTVNTPQLTDAFIKQGLEVRTTTPEQFTAFMRRELAQNAKLAKFAGLRPE